ncbi:M1 family metallopeptidase, partial [bacterium]
EQSDRELKVVLLRPAKFGEIVTFTCEYSGREPRQGLKFVDETPENPRLVWSDSWPDNVHHWFPCFDYPNDKATSEIMATVKAGLKVASNGRLVGVAEDKASGTTTYHWSQDLPHSTYLIFLAAAPYVVVRDSYGTLPVNYWVYPGDEAKAGPTYGKTPAMIAFFNKIFGYDYPWQKYDQISVPLGGGAESTSAGHDLADHGLGGGRARLHRHRDRLPRAGPPVVGRPHHPPQLGPRLDERKLRDVLGLPVSPPRQRR